MTNAVCAAVQASLLATAIVMATKTCQVVCGGSCGADVDADSICDDADNCIDVSTCNYDDSANNLVKSMTNAVCAAVQASLLVTAIVMATKTMSWVSAVAHARPTSMRMASAMMQITAPTCQPVILR